MICSWFALKKRAIRKKNGFLYVFDSFSQFFPLFMPKRELLISLFAQSQKSDRERFTPVAYDNRATGAIHSFSEWIALSLLLEKPRSEFPTLPPGYRWLYFQGISPLSLPELGHQNIWRLYTVQYGIGGVVWYGMERGRGSG